MSTPFPIDDGVPVPIGLNAYHKGTTETLRQLEPGQSFLIPGRRNLKGIHSMFYALKPKRFAARTLPEGVRLWRLE